MITQFPWLNDMCSSEERTKQDANTANDDICNTQERILATHDCPRGDEHLLCPAVERDVKFIPDINLISSSCHDQTLIILPK